MELHRVKSTEHMSDIAAQAICLQLDRKADSVLGLATGTSPIGLYDKLALLCGKGLADFSRVRTVNLDEYCALPPGHEQSYRYFMDRHLFDRVNIEKNNTHLPDGNADPVMECARYDALIDRLGGIDLQLLGIGRNGHIGFNEPDEVFSRGTQRVRLTQDTIDANARLFEDASDVPRYALTMGIRSIMMAGKIILIAATDKLEIVEQALNGPVTPRLPASVLQLHRDVTIVLCDPSA